MKKSLNMFFVVLFILVMSSMGYSETCQGPFDHNTISENYKSIVDEFYSSLDLLSAPCETPPEGSYLYAENNMLLTYFNILRWTMVIKPKCLTQEQKQNGQQTITSYNMMLGLQEKMLSEASPERYYQWKITKRNIGNYFYSHRKYNALIKYCEREVCRTVRK